MTVARLLVYVATWSVVATCLELKKKLVAHAYIFDLKIAVNLNLSNKNFQPDHPTFVAFDNDLGIVVNKLMITSQTEQ